MKLKEAIKEKVNEGQKERTLGRYNASELYSILIGEITPQNFFKGREKDKKSSWNIFWGITIEEALKNIFRDWEWQAKQELKIDDFVISCKADFINEQKVLEVKCPRRLPHSIRKYHQPQLEAYSRAFNRKVEIMYINRDNYRIFPYKPDERYWEMIIEKLREFHKELSKSIIK